MSNNHMAAELTSFEYRHQPQKSRKLELVCTTLCPNAFVQLFSFKTLACNKIDLFCPYFWVPINKISCIFLPSVSDGKGTSKTANVKQKTANILPSVRECSDCVHLNADAVLCSFGLFILRYIGTQGCRRTANINLSCHFAQVTRFVNILQSV